MKKLFIFLCTICTAMHLHAQNPFARYKVEHYDSKNGMPTDFILNAYQTKEGFIWMNTFNGYLRFDGKQFVNFNSNNTPLLKTDNNTSLFTETEDSTLWLPTGNGLLSYKNGVFKRYLADFSNIFLRGKTKTGQLIFSSTETNKKNMLLVFNPSTYQYNKINDKDFLNIISNSGTAKKAEIDNWFTKNGKIIHKDKDGIWQTIAEKEGIQSTMLFSRDDFFVDTRNRVWLNSGYGIFLWNGNRFNLFPGMEKVVIPGSSPSFGYMVEDHQQGIWASMNNTLAYLPYNETRFHVFPKEYLSIQTLHNITIDREQNIWVATDRGLFKLSKTKVVNYAEVEGIQNNRVSSISEVSNNKFIITTPTDQL